MIVNNKIGITLSGGGFRGFAHIGILQYLHELEIKLHAISGASVGSLIGAFVAAGFTPLEILEIANKEQFFTYDNLSIKDGGLFSADIFENIILKYIPHNNFAELKMPLYVAVTDLTNARLLVFNEGSLSFAVKSSCCFPLVFNPVRYKEDIYLCDGGLKNNFPVEHIASTCNKTIGVNINPINKHVGKIGYKDLINRIIRMSTSTINDHDRNRCDLFLQPEAINQFNTFDISKSKEIYRVGYEYAKQFKNEFLSLKHAEV